MIKAIIFDWGGVITKERFTFTFYKTLSNKYDIPFSKLRGVYLNMGVKYEKGEWDSNRFFKTFIRKAKINDNINEIKKTFLTSFEHDKKVLSLIRRLKKNYDIYLFSDNYKELKNILEKKYKFNNLFKKSFYSCDYGITKSNIIFFNKLLDEIKIAPDMCLFIDDIKENVQLASKLGINVLQYKSLENLKNELKSVLNSADL